VVRKKKKKEDYVSNFPRASGDSEVLFRDYKYLSQKYILCADMRGTIGQN
jgi:hypothetical protein